MSLDPLNNLLSKVDALDEILECPVCYERLSGKILLCTEGHHVCRPCFIRLSVCPLCNSTFNGTRNYLAESIFTKFEEIKNALRNVNSKDLNYTAATPKIGSNIVPKIGSNITSNIIEIKKFPCGINDCFHNLSYDDMIVHIRNVHKKDLVDDGITSSSIYCDWWTIEYDWSWTWEKIIYRKNMGIFFVKVCISNKGNVYGYVESVISPQNNQMFYYELDIDHFYDLQFDGPVVSTTSSHIKKQYRCIRHAIYEDDYGDCFDVKVKIMRA